MQPLSAILARWLVFLSVFMTCAVFRLRDYADKSIDLQIGLKLGVWTAGLLFALYHYRLWARRLVQMEDVFLMLLLLLMLFSCLYAPSPAYSLASVFSFIAVLFLLHAATGIASEHELLKTIIHAFTLVIALSLVTYLTHPEFARMREWEMGLPAPGWRLSGITGTANAAGVIAAFGLLCLFFYRRHLPHLSTTYWLMVAINLAGLALSNSRTSMAALLIALLAASLVRATPARLALYLVMLCALILAAFLIDTQPLFAWLSRSGDASEIVTFTNRHAVWSAVMGMIYERPFFGWGYAASQSLIPSAEIGFTAAHAHNIFLQTALTLGFTGLLLFAATLLIKGWLAIKTANRLAVALLAFLLTIGLTEPVAFQGPATPTALALALFLALPHRMTS